MDFGFSSRWSFSVSLIFSELIIYLWLYTCRLLPWLCWLISVCECLWDLCWHSGGIMDKWWNYSTDSSSLFKEQYYWVTHIFYTLYESCCAVPLSLLHWDSEFAGYVHCPRQRKAFQWPSQSYKPHHVGRSWCAIRSKGSNHLIFYNEQIYYSDLCGTVEIIYAWVSCMMSANYTVTVY